MWCRGSSGTVVAVAILEVMTGCSSSGVWNSWIFNIISYKSNAMNLIKYLLNVLMNYIWMSMSKRVLYERLYSSNQTKSKEFGCQKDSCFNGGICKVNGY